MTFLRDGVQGTNAIDPGFHVQFLLCIVAYARVLISKNHSPKNEIPRTIAYPDVFHQNQPGTIWYAVSPSKKNLQTVSDSADVSGLANGVLASRGVEKLR